MKLSKKMSNAITDRLLGGANKGDISGLFKYTKKEQIDIDQKLAWLSTYPVVSLPRVFGTGYDYFVLTGDEDYPTVKLDTDALLHHVATSDKLEVIQLDIRKLVLRLYGKYMAGIVSLGGYYRDYSFESEKLIFIDHPSGQRLYNIRRSGGTYECGWIDNFNIKTIMAALYKGMVVTYVDLPEGSVPHEHAQTICFMMNRQETQAAIAKMIKDVQPIKKDIAILTASIETVCGLTVLEKTELCNLMQQQVDKLRNLLLG